MLRLESSCKNIEQPVVQMTVILLLSAVFEQLVSVIVF